MVIVLTNKEQVKEIDMSKAKSREKETFFAPIAIRLASFSIIILVILVLTYYFTLHCGKDVLASEILDIIKVLVGAIFGGTIAQAALNR